MRSQSQPPSKSPPLPTPTVHENAAESPRAIVEESPLGPISALRAKFEQRSWVTTTRTHQFGAARQNFGSRSQNVNTLKQYDARQELSPKSSENTVCAYEIPMESEEVYQVPKIPDKRPTGVLPAAISQSREQELLKGFERENHLGAPKPIRVMDLISPPADPAPKVKFVG